MLCVCLFGERGMALVLRRSCCLPRKVRVVMRYVLWVVADWLNLVMPVAIAIVVVVVDATALMGNIDFVVVGSENR